MIFHAICFAIIGLTFAQTNDDALFLTPLINDGKFTQAKQLARVENLPNSTLEIESYSGFITVRESVNSNTFFWFYPNANQSAPIILVLGGGPGGSSMFNLFSEVGPYSVDEGGQNLIPREFAWTTNYSVLIVDNPVGVGYSFTESDSGYVRNETDIANDIDFYCQGESYAGKYVSVIGHRLATTPPADKFCNFRGLIMVDALIDPSTQNDYASLCYQAGLLTESERTYLEGIQSEMLDKINTGNFYDASVLFTNTLEGILFGESWIMNVSRVSNHYFRTSLWPNYDTYINYVQSVDVRQKIHVGNRTYNDDSNLVLLYLLEDLSKSVINEFRYVLENYRVLFISGNLDIIVGTPLTSSMFAKMSWSGARQWASAKKQVWRVSPDDVEVAGYVKSVPNLTFAIVRNSGHTVPYYKPREVLNLVDKFLN